ncbi:MAG TPA: DUF1697 domain-containing protein [Bacteroidia bacterium]|jgi:uncharacterized protein (DUF1697 family)|nr:DUF1697 domain-containing protein [Bacteroidia bacterium]
MPKYIAFLRAVNVGGRVVKMEELKKICALPGLKNISTFIQSGNVLFESAADKNALTKRLEAALKKKLNYEVLVFLKTVEDIEAIIGQNPFARTMKEKHLYVTMMSEEAKEENIKALLAYKTKDEEVKFIGTNAYLLFPPKTYGQTKLSNAMLEKKLKVNATTRNWATMNKIIGKEI